ncbi:MAG: patatin-like phospholipase family protein, partial [Bacteroidota bacterium]
MSLQATSFTQDKEVVDLLKELKQSLDQRRQAEEDFSFSDYFDGQNWYVDLVQEGGGVLGVALAGYTYVMEQAGIRFLKLAGTSAGAINTLLLASAGKPSEARSEKVIEQMANLDISSLIDGDQDVQNLVKTISKEDANFLEMAFRVVRVLDDLKDHMG